MKTHLFIGMPINGITIAQLAKSPLWKEMEIMGTHILILQIRKNKYLGTYLGISPISLKKILSVEKSLIDVVQSLLPTYTTLPIITYHMMAG